MATRPPLMTHADRQRLIRAPFPTTRVIPRRLWAGVHIPEEEVPTKGSHTMSDTQWTETLVNALATPDPIDPTDASEDL